MKILMYYSFKDHMTFFPFEELPSELQAEVVKHLDDETYYNALLVSSGMRTLLRDVYPMEERVIHYCWDGEYLSLYWIVPHNHQVRRMITFNRYGQIIEIINYWRAYISSCQRYNDHYTQVSITGQMAGWRHTINEETEVVEHYVVTEDETSEVDLVYILRFDGSCKYYHEKNIAEGSVIWSYHDKGPSDTQCLRWAPNVEMPDNRMVNDIIHGRNLPRYPNLIDYRTITHAEIIAIYQARPLDSPETLDLQPWLSYTLPDETTITEYSTISPSRGCRLYHSVRYDYHPHINPETGFFVRSRDCWHEETIDRLVRNVGVYHQDERQ